MAKKKIECPASFATIQGAIKLHGMDGMRLTIDIDEQSMPSVDDVRHFRQKVFKLIIEEE